jgi:hypothetical protein
MAASAVVWLREGTALALPLMAFRNVKLVESMRFCLPCAVASAMWQPPMISGAAAPTVFRVECRALTKKWLRHAVQFTLLQHAPMFIGAHFYLIAIVDASEGGTTARDEALYRPIAALARQAAVVGGLISCSWCFADFIWLKLRTSNEVEFSPL